MSSAIIIPTLMAVLAAIASASLVQVHYNTGQMNRLLGADINLLQEESGKDICPYDDEAIKVAARFRTLVIEPDYSWLAKDPRVSIAIDNCVATVPAAPSYGSTALFLDLIKDGVITSAGKGVKLSLDKKVRSSDQAPYFSGVYVPFTFGNVHLNPDVNANVAEQIGVTIKCKIAYCILADGSCPLRYA